MFVGSCWLMLLLLLLLLLRVVAVAAVADAVAICVLVCCSCCHFSESKQQLRLDSVQCLVQGLVFGVNRANKSWGLQPFFHNQ